MPSESGDAHVMKGDQEFQWMREALDFLYDELSVEGARELLYNADKRRDLLDALRSTLAGHTPSLSVPAGDTGNNLFQGLIAIRIKFEPEEGRRKVDLNIAMRQRPT